MSTEITKSTGTPSPDGRTLLTPDSIGGLKVVRAGDIQQPERVLIHGPPAIGKTPLLATADDVPAFSPILIINMDRGAKTLKYVRPETRVVSVRTFKALQGVFDALRKAKCHGFKSVAVDGATTTQILGIEHLQYQDEGNTDFVEFRKAQMREWDGSAQQMRILFDAFVGLPVHLFFTAWSRDIAKPKTNRMDEVVPPYWVPDFTPAVLRKACGAFDSIFYMSWHESSETRVLQTAGTPRVMARDRGRDQGKNLPRAIENPTMARLAECWGY